MRLLVAVLAVLALTPAAADAFTPAAGRYAGHDRSQRPVHFVLAGDHVERWRLDNRIDITRAYVSQSNHHFSVHQGHHQLSGHWTDARHVTGVYAYWRDTARGLVHIKIDWSATLTG